MLLYVMKGSLNTLETTLKGIARDPQILLDFPRLPEMSREPSRSPGKRKEGEKKKYSVHIYIYLFFASLRRGRALLPFGNVVRSCPKAFNGCTSSNELDAQYVWPHQRTIKRKSHQTWKACACLFCCIKLSKAEAAAKKGSFWKFRTASQWKTSIRRGSLGHPERRDFVNKMHNRRPTVSLYLDELPN